MASFFFACRFGESAMSLLGKDMSVHAANASEFAAAEDALRPRDIPSIKVVCARDTRNGKRGAENRAANDPGFD